MEILDLAEEQLEEYLTCLEDWSEDIKEAAPLKAEWYAKYKERGLRVKLARDDSGVVGGMIQYLPIEESIVEGQGLHMILCIWVHGHKQGRGDMRRRGMGRALLSAAEEDARALGSQGVAAWGIPLPFWMKASWFRKRGYLKADQLGFMGPVLLYKPFVPEARPPRWIRPAKTPGPMEDCVRVTAICNGWCPANNLNFQRARRACRELGERAVFEPARTDEREELLRWGGMDQLLVDGKSIVWGPPPSYEKIKGKILKNLKKLKHPRGER